MINKLVLALLLEGYDDQGNEDVDEEERKNDEVDDVEYGHLHSEVGLRSTVLVRHVHRMDEDAVSIDRTANTGIAVNDGLTHLRFWYIQWLILRYLDMMWFQSNAWSFSFYNKNCRNIGGWLKKNEMCNTF